MSDQDEQEILRNIMAVASMLRWMGGSVLIVFFTLVVLVVADHYEQANMKRDVEWMRPKVELIWYSTKHSSGEPSVTVTPPQS
jgi:hypothetical protein